MAISYEDWKSQYEWMSTDQQAKYAGMVKGNALAEEYANRYIQEKQDAGTFWQKTARSYTNANAPVNTPTQNTSSVSTPTRNETTPTTTVTPTPTTRQETPTVIGETRKETTRTETPVTTVSEIKQEWALTPLSKEYYSQTSDDAQTKIINNLNSYKASNPEYFTDYETFKRNFSYNARNDEQKNTLDTWYKWYSQGLQLSWTPIADLYTQYKNWSISTGDLESLRIANPTKYAELQAQINKWNIIAAYDDDNQTTETMFDQLRNSFLQNMITNLNASWSGASSIFDSYKEKMESPEMTELWDDAAAKQEEIEKVSADIDSMKKQVEKEYEGTWASRAKINAIVADRTYDLQLQLRSLNSEYNRIATQYNNRMNQYQSEFQLQLQEYQINMQERNQKMNELGFAMDLMNYETPEQKQEREWNYWVRQQEYTNGDINSKDYSTRYKAALKGVENLLSQYQGIPMVRSAEQMAQDILNAIDNGSTLWEELTKINKLIQEKPEYKKVYNATFWNSNIMVNSDWNVWFWVTTAGWLTYTPVSSVELYGWFRDFVSNKKSWEYWGQCWHFVNNYLQSIWLSRIYDNSLTSKLKSINTDKNDLSNLSVWSIAVFDYQGIDSVSDAAKKYGHVAIVTEIDAANNRVKILESNYDWNETIHTRWVKTDGKTLQGFFDPSKWYNSTTSMSNLSSVDEAKKQNYLEEAKRGRISQSDTVKIGDIAAQQGWWNEWRDALNQWLKVNLTDTQLKRMDTADNTFKTNSLVKDFEDASAQINILTSALNANNWAWDLAWIFTFMKVLDPSSVVRESEFESAAKTAWYANPKALYQKYVQHGWDGTWLTEAQRGNFAQLAKELIKSRASLYQVKYNDLLKAYENFWIWADLAPTNMANYILEQLWETTTKTSSSNYTYTPNWLTWYQTTWAGYVDIGWYWFASSWNNA